LDGDKDVKPLDDSKVKVAKDDQVVKEGEDVQKDDDVQVDKKQKKGKGKGKVQKEQVDEVAV